MNIKITNEEMHYGWNKICHYRTSRTVPLPSSILVADVYNVADT